MNIRALIVHQELMAKRFGESIEIMYFCIVNLMAVKFTVIKEA